MAAQVAQGKIPAGMTPMEYQLSLPASWPPPPGGSPIMTTTGPDQVWFTVIAVTCTVIPALFLFMRIYTKLAIVGRFEPADWFIFLAFPLIVIQIVPIGYLMTKWGAGVHQWQVTREQLFNQLYWMNIGEILYCPLSFIVKMAVLLQYLRLFAPERKKNKLMWYGTWATVGACFIFYTVFMFWTMFYCHPRQMIWNKLTPNGKCSDHGPIVISQGAFNMVSDVIILLLPLRSLWSLNVPVWRKVIITLLFATGLLACAASAMRVLFTVKISPVITESDVSHNGFFIGAWTEVEVALGFIVACSLSLPRLIQAKRQEAARAFSIFSFSSRKRSNMPKSPSQEEILGSKESQIMVTRSSAQIQVQFQPELPPKSEPQMQRDFPPEVPPKFDDPQWQHQRVPQGQYQVQAQTETAVSPVSPTFVRNMDPQMQPMIVSPPFISPTYGHLSNSQMQPLLQPQFQYPPQGQMQPQMPPHIHPPMHPQMPPQMPQHVQPQMHPQFEPTAMYPQVQQPSIMHPQMLHQMPVHMLPQAHSHPQMPPRVQPPMHPIQPEAHPYLDPPMQPIIAQTRGNIYHQEGFVSQQTLPGLQISPPHEQEQGQRVLIPGSSGSSMYSHSVRSKTPSPERRRMIPPPLYVKKQSIHELPTTETLLQEVAVNYNPHLSQRATLTRHQQHESPTWNLPPTPSSHIRHPSKGKELRRLTQAEMNDLERFKYESEEAFGPGSGWERVIPR